MRYQLTGSKWQLLLIAVLPLMSLISWGAAPPPATPAASERTLAQIARERIQVADEACKLANEMYRAGRIPSADVFEWARRQAQAHMEALESKADRAAFLEAYVRQSKDNEKLVEQPHQAGVCSALDVLAGRSCRLEAEMWLAKAKEQ